jgi:uncharacterized Zn-finger protein
MTDCSQKKNACDTIISDNGQHKRQKTNNYHCDKCNEFLEIDTLNSRNTHCLYCSKYWCGGSCGELKMTCPYCGNKIIQPD